MNPILAIAVFFIIWWLVLFTVLPFGVRTQAEADHVVPGTPESAPSQTNLVRIFAITTAISLVVFGLVYLVAITPAAKDLIDQFFQIVAGTTIFVNSAP